MANRHLYAIYNSNETTTIDHFYIIIIIIIIMFINVYLPNSSGRTNYRAKMTKKMTLVIIIHETKLMLNDIHPNFYLQNRS
jgi:hypothetical protein